jgi:hypothetical protein
MHGIHSSTSESIKRVVDDLFDKSALRFLGHIPKLHHKKHTLIGFESLMGLSYLFLQAMNNRYINNVEQDVLKGLLTGAYSYINVLKEKTSNDIVQKIEGIARKTRASGEKIPQEELNGIIQEELNKAKSKLEAVLAAESTKTRNLGSVMEITREAAQKGEKDPVVGFAVIRDSSTCPVCIKLNLMDDGVTPRLYRLSELSAGYYKRGDKTPSLIGNHPHCRCTPFYVPSDWGFDKKGHISFIGIGHSELEKQRKD